MKFVEAAGFRDMELIVTLEEPARPSDSNFEALCERLYQS